MQLEAGGLQRSAKRTHQRGLTLEMSGGPKGAKRPLERPLDRLVRSREQAVHWDETWQSGVATRKRSIAGACWTRPLQATVPCNIGSPPDSPEAACLSRMADRRSALPCFGDWPWRAARRRTSRPDQQPPRSPTRKAHGAPPASGRAAQAGDSDSGLRRPLARARRKKNKADITAGGKRKAHGTSQREAKSALHCEKQLPLKRDLTFELRRGAKGAKRPLGRRLERRVRPRECGRGVSHAALYRRGRASGEDSTSARQP